MEWPISVVTPLAALALLTVLTVGIIRQNIRNRTSRMGYPLPPGPPLLSLLRNISFSDIRPWLRLAELQTEFGDMAYLQAVNLDIVFLNSAFVVTALLEKRSHIYSDRPSFKSFALYGHDHAFVFARYGEHWRACRRMFQQTFRSSMAHRFRPMQLCRARELIVNMIDTANKYPAHFSTFALGMPISALYGYNPLPQNDPVVRMFENGVRASILGIEPLRMCLINVFPFLSHLPDWCPGSWIRREAEAAREWVHKGHEMPYRFVETSMASRQHIDASMVSDNIFRMKELDASCRSEYQKVIKQTSLTTAVGALDTTKAVLMVFTLAMVENPHVWNRAQREIDAVVGTGRLPDFEDRPSLQYIDAIIREVLRWRPVFPIGAPHATTQSDVYNGYYIPKDAVILPNVWAILHDPVRYPNEDKFMPERFLDAAGMLTDDNPGNYVFGFGKRKCPGRCIADASLWIAIATMLATLDFNLAKDVDGNDIKFEATFTFALTEHPDPFPCRLTPRPHVDKEFLERVPTE